MGEQLLNKEGMGLERNGQAFLLPLAFRPDLEKKIRTRWVVTFLGSRRLEKRHGHGAWRRWHAAGPLLLPRHLHWRPQHKHVLAPSLGRDILLPSCAPQSTPATPSGPARPSHPRDTEDRAVPEASSVGGPAPRTLAREQDQGRQLLGEGSGPAPSTAVGTDHWTRALSHARAAVSHPHPSAQPR